MTVTLDSPTVIEIPSGPLPFLIAREYTISEFDMIVSDNLENKVTAIIKGIPKVYILWEGSSYISIGNWTKENAITRIKELL